jgi:UDP-glucose 4-epimerase
MVKILVTGGAGYIGSHSIVELVNAGYDPIIVDDFSNSEMRAVEGVEKIVEREIVLHIGNCNDHTFLSSVFKKEKNIKGVIHFAAYKAVGESVDKPLKYYQNNVGSLITLLRVMSEHNVSNLVFSSSCTVYGEPNELPVTELSPILPANSPYGNTKQIGENIIRDTTIGGSLKAISLRYFNPIGAHPSGNIGELPLGIPNNLVPFVTQMAVGLRDKLIIYGDDYNTPDGTCIRDYIHVLDLAKSHVESIKFLLAKSSNNFYDTFNIGTGRGNSVLEVIHVFEKVSGQQLNFEFGERRKGDVEKIYGNVDKAKEILGWESQLTLSEALSDGWRWQQNLSKNL